MAELHIEEELQHLKSDLTALRHEVSDLMHNLGGEHPTGESVREGIRARTERVRAQLRGARERGREGLHDLEENIGQHPIGSVATAAGVGFILGRLIGIGRHH